MRCKVVVPSYNSYPWIEKTLSSIQNQEYPNVDVCVINDASTDPRHGEVVDRYCEANGWLAIHNEENKKALYNIVMGFEKLNCEDDDVLMVIDGDDWLFNPWVFQDLEKVYREQDVLVTVGQPLPWVRCRIPNHPKPSPWRCRFRRYRRLKTFPFSHLRTFKYFLWRNIRDEDLRGADGNYFSSSWDMAIMYPMCEMAGDKIHYETRVQLVYNDNNPINDYKVRPKEQIVLEKYIRSLPKYPVLH